MGMHNTKFIPGGRSRLYIGVNSDYDRMVRVYGTSDFSTSGGDAQTTDIVGHDDSDSVRGPAGNQSVSITQVYATVHHANTLLYNAWTDESKLWCRMRSPAEATPFPTSASVAVAGAALTAATGNEPLKVTLSGSGAPDLTANAYGINNAIVLGSNYYMLRQVLSSTEAYVDAVGGAPTATAAAAVFSIVRPQFEIGPFEVDVLSPPSTTMPSGSGAVWNGTGTLQASRVPLPVAVTDATKGAEPDPS